MEKCKCEKILEWREAGGRDHKIFVAKCSCGLEYHRRKTGRVVYVLNRESFCCSVCNGDILVAEVSHPVHDGPFALSGSGRCEQEYVPYCPQCEEEPNSNGSFTNA